MKGGKLKDATSNKADSITDFFEFSSILRFLQRKERRRRAGSLRRRRNWPRIRLQVLSSFLWRSLGSSSKRRIRTTNLLLLYYSGGPTLLVYGCSSARMKKRTLLRSSVLHSSQHQPAPSGFLALFLRVHELLLVGCL